MVVAGFSMEVVDEANCVGIVDIRYLFKQCFGIQCRRDGDWRITSPLSLGSFVRGDLFARKWCFWFFSWGGRLYRCRVSGGTKSRI